jgi:hypothetical protein
VSDLERFRTRIADRLYSDWHRVDRIRRFVEPGDADALRMINIDAILRCDRWAEFCRACQRTAALIETALWTPNGEYKTATVTAKLAAHASVEAFVVLVKPTEAQDDIQQFRVRQIMPEGNDQWYWLTPQGYARMLVRVRERAPHDHGCPYARQAA